MANTDTWAFFALFLFFFSLGTLLPFIQDAFDQTQIEQSLDGIPTSDDELDTDSVSMLQVGISIVTIFFWSFGQVYFLIDLLILTPLRVLAFWLFIRMVRGN